MATNAARPFNAVWCEFLAIGQRMRDVWNLISPNHRCALMAATVVMAIGAWFNAQIAVVLGDLATTTETMKKADEEWGLREAWPFLAWLVTYFLLRETFQVLRKYLVHATTTRVEKETTVTLVAHLLQIDLATLSRERVGTIHGRIRRAIEGFEKLLRLGFMDLLPAILTAIFALGVAIHRQTTIGLLMAGVIPIASFIVIRQIISQKGIRLGLLRSKESVDGTVVEQLGGIEYVRAANTHGQEVARVEQVAESVREQEIKHHVAMSLFDCAKALNEGAFFIVVVGVSIALAAQDCISVGDIVTYAMLFGSVLTPLREIHRILDEAHESSLKVGDLMGMMAEALDVSFAVRDGREPKLVVGEPAIDISDLAVDYTTVDGTKKRALHSATLMIRQGEMIGVAGPTASGKSTWLRTVLRLVHPTAGKVLFGSVPIQFMTREAIGRLVAYLGQNPFLFAGTVQENIAYGCGDVSADDIRRAAEMACIHEEIIAMPGSYNALVTERGQNLSGGQRQRIALARLFLKRPAPPILILDEGTSALDTISERNVLRAITAQRNHRTVIMVAHRLSTLRDTDRIIVFANGRIAEVGPFDELVRRGGVFAELVHCAAERNGTE